MIYSNDYNFTTDRGTAISIGKFDGLHLGHQKLLNRLLNKRADGLQTLIFTFQVSPHVALGGQLPQMLVTNQERRDMLEAAGIDNLLEVPFTDQVVRMDPEYFIKDFLVGQLHMKYLAVGSDFRFGYKKQGDTAMLRRYADICGYEIDVVEKECYEGKEISSTRIKGELAEGKIEAANAMLGYAYTIAGEVMHGRKIGRTLEMPTVNLIPSDDKMLPPNGVYASVTEVCGSEFEGVTNIGHKPSVGAEDKRGVETYLFAFDEEIYGERIKVKLYAYERPEQKFESLEQLKRQMHADIGFAKEYFRESKRSYK